MNTGSLVNDVLVIVESKVILLKDAKIILLGTVVTTRGTFVVSWLSDLCLETGFSLYTE